MALQTRHEVVAGETEILRKAATELREYLAGIRREFSVPLDPSGTPFQMTVWKALQMVPYGMTRTYEEVALLAGSPRGTRAVGLANNRNPLPIFIPCHRVVGKNGSLVGYGGGLQMKRRLLELEGMTFPGPLFEAAKPATT